MFPNFENSKPGPLKKHIFKLILCLILAFAVIACIIEMSISIEINNGF